MLRRLLNWLGWRSEPPASPAPNSGRTPPRRPREGAESGESAPPEEERRRLVSKPALANLDHAAHRELRVSSAERQLLDRLSERIERGQFDLPHLPATSMALVHLTGRAGVDVGRVVELISSDPTLASELLRTANSVLYATHVPAETLNQAVMRIGLRGLRSLVFTVSVKGTVLKLGQLQGFSEEIWRQAFSVASISRRIAPLLGEDKERAFLVGLLHDIGKVALLAMLAQEELASAATPASVGRAFYVHHERAGALLAAKWRLSEELISVAGCHHRFQENEAYSRSAAIASLAHKLDLHLSFEDEAAFLSLTSCAELDFLGVPEGRRRGLLEQARHAFQALGQEAREAA